MSYVVLQHRPDRLIVRLSNRMIVVAQELHAAPVVSAQVWIKTGSIYEQEHIGAGLSHFLEHLLAGGSTSTRDEEQTNAILGHIGARTNAATGLDNVSYYIDTTSDHTETAIDLLSDWMQNSLIREEEYQRERQVIQREFEHGMGSPGRIFWRLTQQARYRTHTARHPTIGYLDEFLAVTRDQIYDFYRRMYVPNNMLFVVSGDIDRHRVIEQIARLWLAMPARPLPEVQLPVEPPLAEPREMSGVAAISQPKLRLAWPGTRLGAEHDYAMDLLAKILGQGESSRLVRTVRDQKRAVNTISAGNLSFHWGEGFFAIDADVAALPAAEAQGLTPEQATDMAISKARSAIIEQVANILVDGVTEAELARAKRKVLAEVLLSSQNAHSLGRRLAADVIAMGDPDYLTRYAQAIQEITAGQVMAACGALLTDNRLITIRLMPARPGEAIEPLTRPEEPPVADFQSVPVVLDNIVLVDAIHVHTRTEAHAPVAAVSLGEIEQFELSNGLRLLVQKSNLVPAVAIQMYSLGGVLADQPGHEGVANAIAIMSKKGTTTRTAAQITQQLEDLGAELGLAAGNNTAFVQAECLSADWRTVLELAADVAINPSFPEEEWSLLQPRLLAAVRRQTDEYRGELNVVFRREFFGDNHPWGSTVMGRAEVIESLRPEDLLAAHRGRLSAKDTVLAIFGDVEPMEVVRVAEACFKSMPRHAATPFNPPMPPMPVEGVRQITTVKPLAAVQVGFGPGATRRSPDYPALAVLTRVLSNFPSGWLEAELRGAKGDGLTYGVGAYQMAGIVPGAFIISFNTQAQLVPEALRRTAAVVERARRDIVDDTTLARAKASVLVSEFLSKQSNSDRAADAALNTLYELGLDEPEQFRREVEALTPQVLQLVAQRYLQNAVTVVLTDQPLPAEQLEQALRPEAESVAP